MTCRFRSSDGRLAGTCRINPAASPVGASLNPNGAKIGLHLDAGAAYVGPKTQAAAHYVEATSGRGRGGVSNMADKLNSMKVRLCAVMWDLVEMGFFEGRRAMTVLN